MSGHPGIDSVRLTTSLPERRYLEAHGVGCRLGLGHAPPGHGPGEVVGGSVL